MNLNDIVTYLIFDAKCNVKMGSDNMVFVLPPGVDNFYNSFLTINMDTGAIWWYKDANCYLNTEGEYAWCYENRVTCDNDRFTAGTLNEMICIASQEAKKVMKEILKLEIENESI